MASATHPDLADVDLPTVLHALADPVRLGLVRLLSDGEERGWGQLDVPVAKSTLSYHLKVLRSSGITRTREEGTRCFVRLRSDELEKRFPGLLDSVIHLSASDRGVIPAGLKDES
ncbi:ArsR/SmtB family transcription factor [Saccharomonospora glauca]|jgi:DNA-binding transcriptional ArsR family regulator|uniref:Putative transcriptional regulator n=1 Tax=Saccharomonospora glauca K62 TaxID=928724 RepID=I1D4K6_9PSEU|nr:helix-turn-helix domain-containing protein [Saccharomonospora glauca]EIE99880.1 putative transcriptional regulator [Saccharomonospora glauca K62]